MSVEATPIGAVSRIGPCANCASYAIDDSESLLTFDQLGVPGAIARSSQVVEGLRPLLDLPVEHMLATHGVPFERADLERALSL
jgi:hypothetical protein